MEEHSWIQESADKIRDKLAAAAERNQGRLPFGRSTEQTREDYFRTGNPFCWENGLSGGLMWQMVHATQDRTCMRNAVDLESALAGNLRSPEKLGPVAGYQFLPTAVANFHMTRNEVSKQRGLDAAKAMAGCFLPGKGYLALCPLLAGPAPSVDSLLQLPLLYWASETTRDETYRGMAALHAAAVMHQLVREDGSVLPAGEAGSRAGAQALALYGFGLSYLHTCGSRVMRSDSAVRTGEGGQGQCPARECGARTRLRRRGAADAAGALPGPRGLPGGDRHVARRSGRGLFPDGGSVEADWKGTVHLVRS